MLRLIHNWFNSGYCNVSDGKFTTAKLIVPQCLNMCDTLTIRRFFRKVWRYMDAYRYVSVLFFYFGHSMNTEFSSRKGLDCQQTVFAMKQYKSHRRVGSPREIAELMKK